MAEMPRELIAAIAAMPKEVQDALEESGDAFAAQFDRDDPTHPAAGWNETPCPVGGARVPDSMATGVMSADDGITAGNWRDLPEAQIAIEPEYPAEYHKCMKNYQLFNDIKKSVNLLNKPVEAVMKARLFYKGAVDEDKVALLSRLKGEENIRDGALASVTAICEKIDREVVSDLTRGRLEEVCEQGKLDFEEKDRFGEYMTSLQRANQAMFADQKKLLAQIKEIKKATKMSHQPASEEPSMAEAATAGA